MSDQQDFNKRLSNAIKNGRDKKTESLDSAKLLPQARDLEEAVLGAIMLEKNAIDKVVEILEPASFYVDAHAKIFSVMKMLFEESQPIDILTVNNKLKSTGDLDMVGGSYFIASLTNKVASSANIEFHARILAQKYLQRELISLNSNALKDAYDETVDVFDLLDKTEAELFELTEKNMKKNTERIGTVLMNELDNINERRQNAIDGDEYNGVRSGFNDLDKLTAGWQKSDLIILAARPGMGKTAFTLALARNAAVDYEKPVAFFSLEMSANQLVSRLISMETEIDSDKLRKGTLLEKDWKHLTKNIDNLQKSPVFIDDTPAIGIFELRAKCRRLKAKHDVSLIIIDYLQLMTATTDGKGSGNREQEISYISRSLKGIAKELDVPIIALSQLSRAVETRSADNKRPMLSDLRESGAIEQDADMVIFLYRPEYYKINEDAEGNDVRGIGEVIIAKNRHGELKTVKVRFLGQFAKFTNLDTSSFISPDDFSIDNTITMSSKMNDAFESGLGKNAGGEGGDDDDTPF